MISILNLIKLKYAVQNAIFTTIDDKEKNDILKIRYEEAIAELKRFAEENDDFFLFQAYKS